MGSRLPRTAVVLSKDMLLYSSTVLGYYNLYCYLLWEENHGESHFLQKFCDLSISTHQIQALASNIEAVSWLKTNMPPKGKVPNRPCCFIAKNINHSMYGVAGIPGFEAYTDSVDTAIAKEIIDVEELALLDFRKSLSLAVSVLSPLLPEDTEGQEQLPPETVNVIDRTHVGNDHYYAIKIIDDRNLQKNVQVTLHTNTQGEIVYE